MNHRSGIFTSFAACFLFWGYAHADGPSQVDLAPEFARFGLSPMAQGERDVCSLFAITALAEFELAKQKDIPPGGRLSEEYLIWAAHAASSGKGDQAMFYEAVQGLNVMGICKTPLMPYANKPDPARKPSPKARADAREREECWKVHWIKRWDVKGRLTPQELNGIKKVLASGHPIACGLRWPKKLEGYEILHVPGPDQVSDGHSITFTGYQDDPKKPGGGVFLFRNSWGPKWGNQGYGVMSFAYAAAYANDAVWLQLGPPNSETPRARYEGESLPVLFREKCETNVQDMSDWGRSLWSHGKHLSCQAKNGGQVELGFQVDKAGKYRVRVLATAGPDFGKIRIALDGKTIPGEFDLYSGRVCPAGSLELGTHIMAAGHHRIRFTVAGKNHVSGGYFFGIDAIDLLAD